MQGIEKRYRIPPAGGLGVSPKLLNSPKTGGYRGLKKASNRLANNIAGEE